jgi:hypothetical protein
MDENMNNQVDNLVTNESNVEIKEPKMQNVPQKTISTKMIAIIAVAAVAIVAVLALAFGGNRGGETNENGSNDGSSVTDENSLKEAQFESANSAYNDIVSASEICIDIMDGIYGAWYFAIYESDDYSGYSLLKAFSNEVGFSTSEITKAMTDLGLSSTSYYALEDFSTAVHIVKQAYKNDGKYTEAENFLSSAKNSLKSVTSEYSDYTGYPTLKSFYSEVSSYLEFASSPSGSFSQVKTTIDNYETKIRTFKNDLSFIFD